METQWQLLLARLLEADRSRRNTDSHLLTAHKLKCLRKKEDAFISHLFYSPFFVWWSHLFPLPSGFVHFQRRPPPLPPHNTQTRCFGAPCQGGKVRAWKRSAWHCESHSEARKRPRSGFNRGKNKVASFCEAVWGIMIHFGLLEGTAAYPFTDKCEALI